MLIDVIVARRVGAARPGPRLDRGRRYIYTINFNVAIYRSNIIILLAFACGFSRLEIGLSQSSVLRITHPFSAYNFRDKKLPMLI